MKKAFLATTALLAAGNAFAADVTAYGQVNKLIMGVDNGTETNTAIVDNDASSTRFGFKAKQQLDNGLVISGLLELQSESNSSSGVNMEDDGTNEEDDASGISERHSRIGVGSKYGTFLIGKTSEATDGVAEIDLGGVSDIMYSDVSIAGAGVKFVQKSGAALTTTKTVGNVYSNFDGGRENLVRYDSPIFNGVSSSASITSGGDIALAAKYQGKVADRIKVKAGLGYEKVETSTDINDQIMGSISAKCDVSGLAATFAMGQRFHEASNRKDGEFMYTKLSYMPNGSNFEYAVDYGSSENVSGNNEELDAYGIGAQYNIAKGVSTSVMYRMLEADKLSEETDEIQVMTAGLKVKF
jgi:predicted porin